MPTKVTTAGFAAVPYALLDTAPDPFIVTIYAWLHRHGWGSAEGCWTSIRTLAAESSIGHNTVRRAIAWLMHHGWLEARKRDGFTTVYTVKMDTPTGSGRGYPSRIREGGSPELGRGTPPGSGRRTRTPLTTTQEQEPKNKPFQCQTAPHGPAGGAPANGGRHTSEHLEPAPADPKPKRQPKAKGGPDFEAFWHRYNQLQPRSSSSKPKALAAWSHAYSAVGSRLQALLDALEAHHAAVMRAKASGQFMPELPSCQKWLTEARWETVAAASGATSNSHHQNGCVPASSHGMIHL